MSDASDGSPNHAVCAMIVGTEDDNQVAIELYSYKADRFDPRGLQDCKMAGDRVELIANTVTLTSRGNHASMKLEWLPPDVSGFLLNEYFATWTETDDIGAIGFQKCEELRPK